MISECLRPVWAEINLDNLAHNMKALKRITQKDVLVTAVIKADGYGHGAVLIGKTLIENGADRFAVATLSEAIQLRKHFPEIPIMILGYTPSDCFDQVIDQKLIQTIYSVEQAETLAGIAKAKNETGSVHIKIDSGMRRLGMNTTDETIRSIAYMHSLEHLFIEGIYTHFAKADEEDKSFTHEQVRRFSYVVESLKNRGITFEIIHVANSAAIMAYPEYHFDMVRAGIMLYGLYPSDEVDRQKVHLKEVMSLKAKIAQVKTIQKNEGVSYGLKYVAEKETQIATLPLGYADGFSRSLSFKAKGVVHGVAKPIVGRICMDQCMMEVDGLNVKIGDVVTLFGEGSISIDTYASWLGTINYEIVCMIGKRVPRIYTQNGEIIRVEDFNLTHAFL